MTRRVEAPDVLPTRGGGSDTKEKPLGSPRQGRPSGFNRRPLPRRLTVGRSLLQAERSRSESGRGNQVGPTLR